MKIIKVKSIVFPEVKVIQFERFSDNRGYFAETYKKSDFENNPKLKFLKDTEFVQTNASYSKNKVVRGLHFQWKPYMGKLVRTIRGRMVDLFLDIRLGSPTFGKIGANEMYSDYDKNYNRWIWVPSGFAHGSFFTKDTIIEYYCTGEYEPKNEAGISPLAPDIDWSLCNKKLKKEFDNICSTNIIISSKDKQGFTINQWKNDKRSKYFIYKK